MEGRKEGNVLFNDALNTFYLRLYGLRLNYGKGPLEQGVVAFSTGIKENIVLGVRQ